MVKYDDVTVQLTGENGNAFVIIGAVSAALRKAHGQLAMDEYVSAAYECPSYDALLALTMETVHIS